MQEYPPPAGDLEKPTNTAVRSAFFHGGNQHRRSAVFHQRFRTCRADDTSPTFVFIVSGF